MEESSIKWGKFFSGQTVLVTFTVDCFKLSFTFAHSQLALNERSSADSCVSQRGKMETKGISKDFIT